MGTVASSTRESARITLDLLAAVEAGNARTQRRLAADLGIALGLVNVYLKRCVKKGLVKVAQAPARRYAYYLTPKGFTEKSRLTAQFLSWSLTFFRMAKASCGETIDEARDRGWRRIALAGSGDLADVARLCAVERGVEVLAIVDPAATTTIAGLPILRDIASIATQVDGVVLTALDDVPALLAEIDRSIGRHRILAPTVVPMPAPQSGADPLRPHSSDEVVQ